MLILWKSLNNLSLWSRCSHLPFVKLMCLLCLVGFMSIINSVFLLFSHSLRLFMFQTDFLLLFDFFILISSKHRIEIENRDEVFGARFWIKWGERWNIYAKILRFGVRLRNFSALISDTRILQIKFEREHFILRKNSAAIKNWKENLAATKNRQHLNRHLWSVLFFFTSRKKKKKCFPWKFNRKPQKKILPCAIYR